MTCATLPRFYKSLHGLAPQYHVDDLRYVTDIPGRRRLRPASSFQLEVPRTRLLTVGDRTFSAAGSRLWNSLPRYVTECQTLNVFRRKFKHFLLVCLSLDNDCLFFHLRGPDFYRAALNAGLRAVYSGESCLSVCLSV